jgi:hypothetical protein
MFTRSVGVLIACFIDERVFELFTQLFFHLYLFGLDDRDWWRFIAVDGGLVVGDFIGELSSVVVDVGDCFQRVAEQHNFQYLYCVLTFKK